MKNNYDNNFPHINVAYVDRNVEVDSQVYELARTIWSEAKIYAMDTLDDADEGLDLLLEAVIKISSDRETTNIKNLKAYLFKTYIELVKDEYKKKKTLHGLVKKQISTKSEKLLISKGESNKNETLFEFRYKLDDWTKEVFELLTLGYKYRELVPKYEIDENTIRKKFNKNMSKLSHKILF